VKAYSKKLIYETFLQKEKADYPSKMEDLLLLASKMGDMETHFGKKYENKRRGSEKRYNS
jgi:hypothetical protein